MGELKLVFKSNDAEALLILTEIFEKAIDPPVFYHPDMLRVFNELKPGQLRMAVGYSDSKAVIALPFQFEDFYQNVNYPGWDNLGAVKTNACTKDLEIEFWILLLKEFSAIKLVSWSEPRNPEVRGLFLKSFKRRKCPYIELGSSWEDLNQNLGKKLLRNIRQYGNKAKKAGVHFSIAEASSVSLEERKQLLKQAFAFHEKRMLEINQDTKFSSNQQYHEKVMECSSNLFFIKGVNDKNELIACYYGLYNKSRLAWFNGGYDGSYANLSIGTLLVSELIDFAYETHRTKFDFLRGNESYKSNWTSQFDLNHDHYVSNYRVLPIFHLYRQMFKDLKVRMGSMRAMKMLIAS